MLIGLCSKNNESDVLGVFNGRDDMILKRDHIMAVAH
jgi:predicted enzyme involved in methoxymalonyl-ACP biosynthesis